MATVTELERKLADLKSRVESAKENLTRQESARDSFLKQIEDAKKENETLQPGSPQYIANEQIIAYQTKNVESITRGSLKDAQDAVDGWSSQVADTEKELTEARNTTPQEKEEESAGQKVNQTVSEKPKESENKSQDDFSENRKSTPPNKAASGERVEQLNNFSSPSLRLHNPLSDFSSSTYKLSLYSITPEAYNNYYQKGKWDKKDLYLIVQSGGILNTSDSKLESKRAAGFELDYFIDNLEIETATAGQETGGVSNQLNFKFQVFEPYGITFPTKLVANQVKIQQMTSMKRTVKQQIEALQGHFLLTIRFYGYDENGALGNSSKYNDGSFAKTDEQAAFERSFPIVINKFNFSISNKVTVYDINAKLVNEQVSTGIKRGVLPVIGDIVAETVGEALGGENNPGTNGLFDKLNKLQKDLVKSGKQRYPDLYSVSFDPSSGIEKAKIVEQNTNKDKVPMLKVTTADEVNDRSSSKPESQIVQKKRVISLGNGIPIVQAVDQIISQSSYVTDALLFKDSEEAEPVTDGEENYSKNPNPKTLAWYIVVPKTEIYDYDDLRNDYAYKITYVIKRYEVPYIRSLSHKYVPKYYGPHKRYNYWYTGHNTEVLSYEQQYNLLYFNASALSSESATENTKDSSPNKAMPGQVADPTSLAAGAFEAANSIKTFLYSPGDQLKARISILGDPDFLMPATAGTISEILKKWYGPDFTVNPNSGQVFIEIVFQQVEDYGDDGLLTPNNNITFWDYPSELKTFIKGMVYMVTKVTSKFSKGKFTQDLKTVIPNFSDMQVSGSSASNKTTPTPKTETATTRETVKSPSNVSEELRIQDQEAAAEVKLLSRKYPAPNRIADDDAGTDPIGAEDGSAIMRARGSASAGGEREEQGAPIIRRLFG